MMRSFIGIRFVGVGIIISALIVGFIMPVAAQDATAEATQAFTSPMMTMEGACPQGMTSVVLQQMMTMQTEATAEATMETTEAAPAMEATEEATTEAMAGPECLVGAFSGAAEVPGPGDDDAMGVAFITFDSSTGDVCYDVAVANITLPAAKMHIHKAEAGVAGDVVIPFPTAPDANGVATGCTTVEDMTLLQDLAANPAGYYVNVHTSDFPDGAARAQLVTLATGEAMMQSMGMNMSDMMGNMTEATPEATP
jgi:hypothetical protein